MLVARGLENGRLDPDLESPGACQAAHSKPWTWLVGILVSVHETQQRLGDVVQKHFGFDNGEGLLRRRVGIGFGCLDVESEWA